MAAAVQVGGQPLVHGPGRDDAFPIAGGPELEPAAGGVAAGVGQGETGFDQGDRDVVGKLAGGFVAVAAPGTAASEAVGRGGGRTRS